MQLRLLEVLACPTCRGKLGCVPQEVGLAEEIVSGNLTCQACDRAYPILQGIPRFVDSDNYSSSFGYQWNHFRVEQLDSHNGTTLSAQRFSTETKWTKEWLAGKWILDVGCGAGRFLDVAANAASEVVGVDLSNAVDAAQTNLAGHHNIHLVQASIYALPFREGAFDGCYCIGVIQHTPDPLGAVRALPRVLKRGGRIALTIYERKPRTLLYSKYLLRPLTKRMDKAALARTVRWLMPILFPLTEVAFRLPYLGRFLMFVIPVANYVNERQLSLRQRYRWAILDTFDMLSPQYDQPQAQRPVEEALASSGIVDIHRTTANGLSLVGRRSE